MQECRQRYYERQRQNTEEARFERQMKKIREERKKERDAARLVLPRFPNKKELERVQEEYDKIQVKRYVPPKKKLSLHDDSDFKNI